MSKQVYLLLVLALCGCGKSDPVVPVNPASVLLEARRVEAQNARTNPPPGYVIQCSRDGKYRFATLDGREQLFCQDSREETMRLAWSSYDHRIEDEKVNDAISSNHQWEDCK